MKPITSIETLTPGVTLPGAREVKNPALSYDAYLHLTELLGAQTPVTAVADEQAFIVVHQQIELAFRLAVFDLALISATFERLCQADLAEAKRLALASEPLESSRPEAAFWRPARTAAARLRLAGTEVLPVLLKQLGRHGSPTFSTSAFGEFRAALEPASGFQSTQFRLIERAFGKTRLLDLPVFPRSSYRRHYGAQAAPSDPTLGRVTDPAFRAPAGINSWQADPAEARALTALEERAVWLLARLCPLDASEPPPPPVQLVTSSNVELAVSALARIHAHAARAVAPAHRASVLAEQEKALAEFAAALAHAAGHTNAERQSGWAARLGAYALKLAAPESALIEVLDALVAADDHLFGEGEVSFLGEHQLIATTRIRALQELARPTAVPGQPDGTGGGGPAYLGWRRTCLVPLFPMLAVYRGIDEAEALSWID